MTTKTTTRRKVLVPLATLLAAGAIAVGSGATFTSTSQNVGSKYEAGTVKQSNSLDSGSIFDVSNMKPGDTVNGKVTVTNTGSLVADFKLTESAVTNTFAEQDFLRMTVTDVTGATPKVVSGADDIAFGNLGSVSLGRWAAGETHTFKFSVTLDTKAGDSNQGKQAGATYTWNSTQDLVGVTTDQH